MPDEQFEVLVPPSDAELEALALEILVEHRKTTLDFALWVGRLVVGRLYRGNIELWRQHGQSDGSFRRLAKALEGLGARGLSATALQQAVATLDLEERVAVSARPQLSVSHVRAVIGLPPDKQEALLGKSEAGNWASERLEKEAARAKQRLSEGRTGRPPTPTFVLTVCRWERDIKARKTQFAGIEKAAALKREHRARVRAAVAAVQAECAAVLAAIGEDPSE